MHHHPSRRTFVGGSLAIAFGGPSLLAPLAAHAQVDRAVRTW